MLFVDARTSVPYIFVCLLLLFKNENDLICLASVSYNHKNCLLCYFV